MFKTRAGAVERGVKAEMPDLPIVVNPVKARKGAFVVTGVHIRIVEASFHLQATPSSMKGFTGLRVSGKNCGPTSKAWTKHAHA